MKLTAENLKDEVATLQLPSDLMELYNEGVRDMLEFYGEDKELTETVDLWLEKANGWIAKKVKASKERFDKMLKQGVGYFDSEYWAYFIKSDKVACEFLRDDYADVIDFLENTEDDKEIVKAIYGDGAFADFDNLPLSDFANNLTDMLDTLQNKYAEYLKNE